MNTTTKWVLGIIAGLVIIAAGAWYFLSGKNANTVPTTVTTNTVSQTAPQPTTKPPQNTNKSPAPVQKVSTTGRVVISVTDATADLSTIDEINMKVNSVELHSSVNGWVTASITPRVYSLLRLNADNQSQFLADVNVKAGTYDQIRLDIDSVSVREKNSSTFQYARLPSNVLRISTTLVVNADKTASANLDFIANQSLNKTDEGKYIYAPVVRTETRSNASVYIDTRNVVIITDGQIDSVTFEGMDIDGSVRFNFSISTEKLTIDQNGIIRLK